MYEKEACSVLTISNQLEYVLLWLNPVQIFRRHKNLLYWFAPITLLPNCQKYELSKVHGSAIHFSNFTFVTEHVDRTKNVFANLLRRWCKGYRLSKAGYGSVADFGMSNISSMKHIAVLIIDELTLAKQNGKRPHKVGLDKDGLYNIIQKYGCQKRQASWSSNIDLRPFQKCGSSTKRRRQEHCMRNNRMDGYETKCSRSPGRISTLQRSTRVTIRW